MQEKKLSSILSQRCLRGDGHGYGHGSGSGYGSGDGWGEGYDD